jgi:hypothetical protein
MRREIRTIFFLFLTSTLFAQGRFDGIWEMKMDTVSFSGGVERYLLDQGTYHCFTCVPGVEVQMDGSDQNVSGHPPSTALPSAW